MKKFTCSAPAKVNLFLEISQKRADGYHEAYSIMHTLALHDEIEVDIYDSAGEQQPIVLPTIEIELHCADGIETLDVALQENSAYRAAALFFECFTHQIPDISHVHITITKYIPHQAGLGGGSSDAAAVLKVLCSYFNIDLLSDGVLKIAYTLGADVAFFLYGGAVALGNRGDAFERRLTSTYQPIVLVKPQGGVSTAAAYNAFDSGSYEIDAYRAACARAATEAQNILLANNLAPASEVLLGE
ncbi:MAG: 4-(cytidine 5'-diphospho)-2-C-methyl-D-erythritol kinase, partial [Eggerthellaceae bacterium]|nr:4-(cytidine 5'-diphospho)-2-C-methyl-D-erythritol kinase [Eggerthellaceae bacterium]